MSRRAILLLVEKCSHAFSYYDIDSGERIRSIPLPAYPHEFVIDSRRKYAYVGHYGVETSGHHGAGGHVVFVIDLETGEHVRNIDCSPYNRLHGMQMDEQGRLYVLSEEKATLLVFERPETAGAIDRAVPAGGIKSHLFALTRDGQRAFVMNLLSHTVTQVRPYDPCFAPLAVAPGNKPEGYCLSADESVLYVTNRLSNTIVMIDTASMAVTRSAPSQPDATRIYLARDGRLLVTNYGGRSLSVFDPATLDELAHVEAGARPIALSLHPERNWALVSLDDNRVGILDLDTLKFIRHIPTQLEPDVSRVIFQ
jgi:YVTN family beta-propeller protein